jgi:hypothetical protein
MTSRIPNDEDDEDSDMDDEMEDDIDDMDEEKGNFEMDEDDDDAEPPEPPRLLSAMVVPASLRGEYDSSQSTGTVLSSLSGDANQDPPSRKEESEEKSTPSSHDDEKRKSVITTTTTGTALTLPTQNRTAPALNSDTYKTTKPKGRMSLIASDDDWGISEIMRAPFNSSNHSQRMLDISQDEPSSPVKPVKKEAVKILERMKQGMAMNSDGDALIRDYYQDTSMRNRGWTTTTTTTMARTTSEGEEHCMRQTLFAIAIIIGVLFIVAIILVIVLLVQEHENKSTAG